MPQDMVQDVIAIKEWLAKEYYLPKDFDDKTLMKFLHSCHRSLERTKKCIERFCVGRSNMSEIYTSRDPLSPELQTAFSIGYVATYPAGEDEILIHQIEDPTLEHYNFYNVLKSFTIQSDFWIKEGLLFPQGHFIIIDMKDYSLKIIPKVNVMYYRDFLLFLLDAMPVRVKQIHAVNCPSFYEILFNLVKPALPADIRDMIKFHSTPEGLHQHINRHFLPSDYGGEAESIKQQHQGWVKIIEENREVFLNESMWKADLTTRPKANTGDNGMSGSFRTLAID